MLFCYFCFIFLLIFFLRGERLSHTMFLVLHLKYIYTLSSFICRFKKHMWKSEILSWCQVSMIICWQGLNLLHILSHLVCLYLSLCNVCRVQNWKLLLPLCIFLTSMIHYNFKQWCWFLLGIRAENGYISKWKKLYSFEIMRKF